MKNIQKTKDSFSLRYIGRGCSEQPGDDPRAATDQGADRRSAEDGGSCILY